MTTDMEKRLAKVAEELKAVVVTQRRMARIEDYMYDKSQEQFWDIVDGTLHGEQAVDASIPVELWRVEVDEGDSPSDVPAGRGRPRKRKEKLIPPSRDIMRVENNQFLEGSTWWPGQPRVIKDKLITKDGMQSVQGRWAFNTYNAPPQVPPNASATGAQMWVDHIRRLWPDPQEHEYFFDYCAHMLQFPDVKCNAAIVLSGTQGIGKDAALQPVKEAVGDWNAKNIDPDELFSPFRPWLQSVMLVVDEVRPSKDEFHASSMYNTLKPLVAAPPNTLPMNDKHAKLRHIVNVLRVFLTTNDWLAMYIPEEDRRMFIMHSPLPQKWHELAGDPDYFVRYWGWLESGGYGDVAAWLSERNLRSFNPKAQIKKTAGWEAVAGSWSAPDDGIQEALEGLCKPDVFFSKELLHDTFDHKEEIAAMMKSPRKIAHRLQKEGYTIVKCPEGDKWDFQRGGKRLKLKMAFVKQNIFNDQREMIAAVRERGYRLLEGGAQLTVVKSEKF